MGAPAVRASWIIEKLRFLLDELLEVDDNARVMHAIVTVYLEEIIDEIESL